MPDDATTLAQWASVASGADLADGSGGVKKRRSYRWIAWVVILGIVAAVVAFTAVTGDKMARDLAADVVRDKVISAFGLESGHRVDVSFGEGLVLFQLVGGSIDTVTIGIDDVPLGDITGDLALVAAGVPLDAEGATDSVTIDIAVDEANVQKLGGYLSTAALGSIALVDDQIEIGTSITVFGAEVPVGVKLAPSAVEGNVAFTPTAITLASAEVSAEQLRALGPVADAILASRSLCIAGDVPKALVLTNAAVVGKSLELRFTARDVVLASSAFLSRGSCATP